MVYTPQRNFKPMPPGYTQAQHSAMRWLAKQGLAPEEIREARWGMVDETTKTISIPTSIIRITYNRDNKVIYKEVSNINSIKIPLKGTGHEWFFLESRIYCPWIFTKVKPKTWRKEGSREVLYSLSEVEHYCRNLDTTPINTSLLTKLPDFDRIEVSNLNITKLETEETTREVEEEVSA